MYYDSLKPNDGYVDADDLIGKRLWFHTNRSHAIQGRNGMVGIYSVTSNGTKKSLTKNYTNEVRLKSPIHFQTSESGAKRIQKSKETQGGAGKRTLIAGVSGVVVKTKSGNLSGMKQARFNPFDKQAPWFYLVSDSDKKEIVSADEVYFRADENTPDNMKWYIYVKNPKFSGKSKNNISESVNDWSKFIEMFEEQLEIIDDQVEYVKDELRDIRGIDDWEIREYKSILKDLLKRQSELKNHIANMSKTTQSFTESNGYSLEDIIYQIKTYEKPTTEKLLTIKVINKLKEKRNKSKSTKNTEELQKLIDKLESDYKGGKYLKESVNEAKKLKKDDVVFQVSTGNNPFTGQTYFRDVTNQEIKDETGKYWDEWSKSDQIEVKNFFMTESVNEIITDGDVVIFKKVKGEIPKIRYNSYTKEFSANFLSHTDYYKNLTDAIHDMKNAGFKIEKHIQTESVNEANDTYFNTASESVNYARKMIEKRGFEIDEDDWNTSIVHGGKYNRLRPDVGKTHSFSIGLLKNGKPQRKMLQISLYGMPSGKYELTYYVN